MKNVFNVNPELIADSLRRKPIDHTGQRFFMFNMKQFSVPLGNKVSY